MQIMHYKMSRLVQLSACLGFTVHHAYTFKSSRPSLVMCLSDERHIVNYGGWPPSRRGITNRNY